jgi:H+/Cl- antiporter ClcA
VVGVICGVASAAFLGLLDVVTKLRGDHAVLVYALPVAGLLIGLIYERFGRDIKAGNNLVIDTIHDGGPQIPLRMAPMVLFGTVLTHLFGGSAGREGTAVQMGASLSDFVAHRMGWSKSLRRTLLVAGVSGGFGSVFGTPIAGTLFGLEFIVLGRIEYAALVPALVAAIVGDWTTRSLGIAHAAYPRVSGVDFTPLLLLKWLVFALAIALTTRAFIGLLRWVKRYGERWIPKLWIRMFVGGMILVGMWWLVGTSDYLGLGVPTILRAFHDPHLPIHAFLLKVLFTVVTLGSGFLGGEVTPLFFVGATLGNALARALGLPLELGAGVGLAAVFAAASNTPISLSIMAVELLGHHLLPHVFIVCVIAYLLSGHRSIYPAQRVFRAKVGQVLPQPVALRDWDQLRDDVRSAAPHEDEPRRSSSRD